MAVRGAELMKFIFSFYIDGVQPELQNARVRTYGGHVGTAFNRAWTYVKGLKQYKGTPGLLPSSVGITKIPKGHPHQGRTYETVLL